MNALERLPDAGLTGLDRHLAGVVNLRRDVYRFVDFARHETIKRSHRANEIPRGPATKLSKLLSWEGEAAYVQADGIGYWSDYVSDVARWLGLVNFDVKGVYAGYSSNEPSFPDNFVKVDAKGFATWLEATPVEKERRILDALTKREGNEFLRSATLFPEEPRFGSWGSALGPLSRMKLPAVRQRLLTILAELPVGVWMSMTSLVEHVKTTARAAILSPDLKREPPSEYEVMRAKPGTKVPEKLVDLYQNFTENPDDRGLRDKPRPITEQTPDAFERVEGRYLQYFLQEIPYLCGFVDLALAKLPAKLDYGRPLMDRVRAFRLTPRLAQVVRGDAGLNRVSVTVLPDFQVIVEAPSWPDREIEVLAQLCVTVKEDGPIHHLKIDRKQVVAWAAGQREDGGAKTLLETLSGRPMPGNVSSELDAWCGHAEKLTVLENVAVVELRGPDADAVRGELGKLVVDQGSRGFVVTTDPERTVAVLEQRQRVPRVITHGKARFAECDGLLGAPARSSRRAVPAPPQRRRARVGLEDLVGVRSDDPKLLIALRDALVEAKCWCNALRDDKVLLVRAKDLLLMRTALRRLADRFEVDETP